MNTLIICATVVASIYIVCYYINKLIDEITKHENLVNSMSDDIVSIKDIIDRTYAIDVYNDTVKHNLLTINHILSKYVEEPGNANTSTKES